MEERNSDPTVETGIFSKQITGSQKKEVEIE